MFTLMKSPLSVFSTIIQSKEEITINREILVVFFVNDTIKLLQSADLVSKDFDSFAFGVYLSVVNPFTFVESNFSVGVSQKNGHHLVNL